MGDALGDILYILLMLAALVFSIYKKSKSAGHDGDVMPEYEAGDSPGEVFPSFKDLFADDDDEMDKPVKREQSPEPKVVPMQAEKMIPNKLEYKKPVYQSIRKRDNLKKPERVSRISQKISRISLASTDNFTEETSYWDDEDFNLQKAIIYSEIIKRPTI